MTSVLEQLSLSTGHVVTVSRDGHIVACCEYDWVKDYDDMMRADAGTKPLGGPVLYVSNIVNLEENPYTLWLLKHQLPWARWIVGMSDQWEIRAPKGLPDGFFA